MDRVCPTGPKPGTWGRSSTPPKVLVRRRSHRQHVGPTSSTTRSSAKKMQFAEIALDPGEVAIAEAGAMMYMTEQIKMETVFGDPSAGTEAGFFGKVLTAGKRMLTGESMFMTTFKNVGHAAGTSRLRFPLSGQDCPLHLDELGGEIICQKDSFLCAAHGVQIGIAYNKKFRAGLFGGRRFHHAEADRRRNRFDSRRWNPREADAARWRGIAAGYRVSGGSSPRVDYDIQSGRRYEKHVVWW